MNLNELVTQLKNIENLINYVKNKETLKKLHREKIEILDAIRKIKKESTRTNIYTKYIDSTPVKQKTNQNKNERLIEETRNIKSIIKEYIKKTSPFKVGDFVELKDKRKGYIVKLFYNSNYHDDKNSGILAILKRLTKKGKVHHLYLSKYGMAIENIKGKIK